MALPTLIDYYEDTHPTVFHLTTRSEREITWGRQLRAWVTPRHVCLYVAASTSKCQATSYQLVVKNCKRHMFLQSLLWLRWRRCGDCGGVVDIEIHATSRYHVILFPWGKPLCLSIYSSFPTIDRGHVPKIPTNGEGC